MQSNLWSRQRTFVQAGLKDPEATRKIPGVESEQAVGSESTTAYLTDEQQKVYDLVMDGESVFLTGVAGKQADLISPPVLHSQVHFKM